MLNGDGLRVTLWVAGCEHHCANCHNPTTWDIDSGIPFDVAAMSELLDALNQDYISGLTLSGGDPMHTDNREEILRICNVVKQKFPQKNIWMYTGYTFEEIKDSPILTYVDILIDGKYVDELKDTSAHWVGSTNQKVIDLQETLKQGQIIQYKIN
jgi:anaerobic ribonucleoside-triphosphate reductase activating protein